MSKLSEIEAVTAPFAEPEPRWTVPEFHDLVTKATHGAWQNTAHLMRYSDTYNVMECGLRAAFPDRVPPLEGR